MSPSPLADGKASLDPLRSVQFSSCQTTHSSLMRSEAVPMGGWTLGIFDFGGF